jgi:hypothetical protein
MGNDMLRYRAIIDRVGYVVAGGCRSRIRIHDEIDQYILFVGAFVIVDSDNAPKEQILDDYLIHGYGRLFAENLF